MQDRNRIIFVVLIIYFTFGLLSIYKGNIQLDEKESHLPTTQLFFQDNLITALQSKEYRSASTPLPYILVSLPHKLLNITPSIHTTRLANVIISLITLSIFILLVKSNSVSFLFPALILIFYPYFLKPSFDYFMAIYGLLFYLLFIYFAQKEGGKNYFYSGLFLTLAILSQQFYLIVAAFYFLYLFYLSFKEKKHNETLKTLVLFSAPFLLVFILIYLWGGLTHPSYRTWGVEFHLEYFTAVLIVLGSTLLPFLLFNFKKLTNRELVILISVSMILSLFAYPLWVNAPTVGGITGYTFHVIAIINNHSPVISFISKTILCFLGLSTFLVFYKYNKFNSLLFLLFIALSVGFTINKLPSERHMVPLIVTGYLLAFKSIKSNLIYKIWLPLQILIGSIYFYYIMFN